MEGTLSTLISLLIFGAIIILFILGKLKVFTSLSLFLSAGYSFVVGLILIFTLPEILKTRIKQGPDIPYFPIVIGIIIVVLAILCLFIDKLSTRSPNRPPRFRWIWLVSGEAILITGLGLALFALYAHKNFGYSMPLPALTFLFWFSFSVIAYLIFYKASRMNSEAYPNLMRYVVFLFTYLNLLYTLILSLILIYSGPTKISYVFWAALITLGFLPPSLVMLGLTKDHLPVGILEAPISPNQIKNIEG